jgi:hypothetical protein
MEFQVLAATGADGRLWSDLARRLPPELRDLHFLPEYGLIYRDTYGHEPLLAYAAEGANFVIQPFVKRTLNALPFLAQQNVAEPFWDIANAYGYGGPLCFDPAAVAAPDLLARFEEQFSSWCVSQGIAAEFCSLHPLLGNRALLAACPGVEALPQKSVVCLDLTRTEDELWRAVNRGHRSSIQRARQAGVSVERVAADEANFAEFERLYSITMDRHSAADRWYFPAGYFRDCARHLGPGRVALFFARAQGKVASAYLLLHDAGIAYYHFGGSDDAYFALRPNNLLLYETALWARSAGNRVYHLGGGVTAAADDTLLRFKSGFGGETATLYTYGRVHDRAAYDRLCELKMKHERATLGTILESHYFPLYRRGLHAS